MQTPSDQPTTRDWAPRTSTPRRSIFGNYTAEPPAPVEETPDSPAGFGMPNRADLDAQADRAVARAFIYQWLATCYQDPDTATWDSLSGRATFESLQAAAEALNPPISVPALQSDGFESYHEAYLAAFGHAARGSCPLNEIEYGDIKADPLFQPHRLADLAAFYRAFGLELAEDAGERQDHICIELEFMCVLAAKEAYAIQNKLAASNLVQCHDAQRKFLREHLGRWIPAFTRRLTASTSDPSLRALAEFTRLWVEADCARFGVRPGSEDLLLRPVDEQVDSMCSSCGIANLPPGA